MEITLLNSTKKNIYLNFILNCCLSSKKHINNSENILILFHILGMFFYKDELTTKKYSSETILVLKIDKGVLTYLKNSWRMPKKSMPKAQLKIVGLIFLKKD